MKTLILTLILASSPAFAAATPKIYIVNGQEVNSLDALSAAMKGDKVMQCQGVVATPNKTGTAIGLHAPKKAK